MLAMTPLLTPPPLASTARVAAAVAGAGRENILLGKDAAAAPAAAAPAAASASGPLRVGQQRHQEAPRCHRSLVMAASWDHKSSGSHPQK